MPRWKRHLDIGCVLLTAPAWLLVMGAVMAWIRAVSPGPLFFHQERVGYKGRRFTILKFRSMKTNAETVSHQNHLEHLMQSQCPMTKLDAMGDSRLIAGGRILRASGLDELPQLLNVLRGEMSLVGPRPCTPYEFEKYEESQKLRVDAPPGLTGYWQVNGKNNTTFAQMITMDIYYTRNLSLGLDLAILLKTGFVVARQLWEARNHRQTRNHMSAGVLGAVVNPRTGDK